MPKETKTLNNFDEISILKAMIFDTPIAVHTKVQLIKEEIASNQYQINHHHIATKLVEHAPLAEEMEMA